MTSPKSIIGILLALAIVFAGAGAIKAAERTTSPAASTDIGQGNPVLLQATSPFEDLVEYALKDDRQGMEQAIAEYEGQASKVLAALPEEGRRNLQERVTRIKSAEARGDTHEVAKSAVEAYRILIGGLNPGQLAVPVPVMMLDYVGFKELVLLNASPPDWAALEKIAAEGRQYWNRISPRVHDGGLRDTVETMFSGMEHGIMDKNKAMTDFAAQMNLALVDLLEAYFRP